MSRTYRRTNKYNDAYKLSDIEWLTERYRDVTAELAPSGKAENKARAVFHSDRYRVFTTPMWWYHEYSQVPHRRHCRDQLKKLTFDNLDELIIPNNRKPQIYYW